MRARLWSHPSHARQRRDRRRQRRRQRHAIRSELTSVADGFTLAAVGDNIIARPLSQMPGFAPVGKIIRDADAAFGNFEGTAIVADAGRAAGRVRRRLDHRCAIARRSLAIGFDDVAGQQPRDRLGTRGHAADQPRA
jgi:hypothetical protein